MPSYDSPIGKKQFPGQPFREVTIPDESNTPSQARPQNYPPVQFDPQALQEFTARMNPQSSVAPSDDVKQQFQDARDAKRLTRDRLNDAAKRRLEILLGMTRHTRSFEIGGNTFTLRTLRSNELEEAVVAATVFDGTVRSPFQIRKQLLARSLTQIAGADADQFFGTSDVELKLMALDDFDHYLLGRLYDEYLAMVKEAQEKYAVRTAEQAQEVVEDLKK